MVILLMGRDQCRSRNSSLPSGKMMQISLSLIGGIFLVSRKVFPSKRQSVSPLFNEKLQR